MRIIALIALTACAGDATPLSATEPSGWLTSGAEPTVMVHHTPSEPTPTDTSAPPDDTGAPWVSSDDPLADALLACELGALDEATFRAAYSVAQCEAWATCGVDDGSCDPSAPYADHAGCDLAPTDACDCLAEAWTCVSPEGMAGQWQVPIPPPSCFTAFACPR